MSKNIVITGTSRGIGLQTAILLSDQGHNVIALSRKSAPQLLGRNNITSLNIDIANAEGISQFSKYLEDSKISVDAIIHNAGHLVLKPFAQTTTQDFLQTYNVNVFGVAEITRTCLPYMKSGSHVVTISSMGGIQGSSKFAGLSAYSSSKGAVITLSELLAEEYREQGVSFNVLALGAVQTEMLATAFPGYNAPLTAEEIAKYIADFALNGQKFFNGKTLQVSSSTP